MKKILLPLFIVLLLTGCTKIDRTTNEYKDIVNSILSNQNYNVNTASVGYKYYVPIGVNLCYDGDLNKEFKIRDTKMVMYVDIISYYYKNTLNYIEDSSGIYYYEKLDNGYIYIEKNDNGYYLKLIHNYAKIESYVNEKDLTDVIVYSTIILNSITYNDNLISNVINKGITFGNEIIYEIDKPENSESKFSQYLQEYVQDNSEEQSSYEIPIDEQY